MKKFFIALSMAASMLAAVPNPPAPAHNPNGWPDDTSVRYSPWGQITYKHCLSQWSLGVPGAASMIGAQGVQVQATMTAVAQTGWHPHTAGIRPNAAVVSATPLDNFGRVSTGVDGCVTYKFASPGYSGWYLILFIPGQQAPCGCSVTPQSWPQFGRNVYLGAVDWLIPGVQKGVFLELGQLTNGSIILTQPTSSFPDNRHANHSRSVNRVTMRKIALFVSSYMMTDARTDSPGPVINLARASLPDGGIADNERQVSGGYTNSEYTFRSNEGHMYGYEFDVVNPGVSTGNILKYDMMEAIAGLAGCYPGHYDQNTNYLSDPHSYWRSQSLVHLTCGLSPFRLPGQ